jgi:hypothetical protein
MTRADCCFLGDPDHIDAFLPGILFSAQLVVVVSSGRRTTNHKSYAKKTALIIKQAGFLRLF